MIKEFFKALFHAALHSEIASSLIHCCGYNLVAGSKSSRLNAGGRMQSTLVVLRNSLSSPKNCQDNRAFVAPSKPVLTGYVVEEHTTPKTNAAKKHWQSLSAEEKANYAKRPHLLLKKGYQSHWDIRIQQPGEDKFVSFATKKNKFPLGDEKLMWIQTTQGHGYEPHNPPVIESGYGMGTTRVLFKGQALVWEANDGGGFHISFEHSPKIYLVIPTDPNWDYCLVREKAIPLYPHRDRPWEMKDISGKPELLQSYLEDNNCVFLRKYDGSSHTVIIEKIKGKQRITILSRKKVIRDGKEVLKDGQPVSVNNTYNVAHLSNMDVPEKYYEKGPLVMQVELYAETTGNNQWETPHAYLTSVLNSSPAKAEMLQQKHGRVRLKCLDLIQMNGEDVFPKTYAEKRKIMEQMHQDQPLIRVPKAAYRVETKSKLLSKLKARGDEGAVIRPLDGNSNPVKYKFKLTWDLKIVGVEPVQPTSSNSKWVTENGVEGAGCVVLENGQRVKIPTDSMKRDAHLHPELYIGKTATIQGERMSPKTGAIRAPVFLEIHLDK